MEKPEKCQVFRINCKISNLQKTKQDRSYFHTLLSLHAIITNYVAESCPSCLEGQGGLEGLLFRSKGSLRSMIKVKARVKVHMEPDYLKIWATLVFSSFSLHCLTALALLGLFRTPLDPVLLLKLSSSLHLPGIMQGCRRWVGRVDNCPPRC